MFSSQKPVFIRFGNGLFCKNTFFIKTMKQKLYLLNTKCTEMSEFNRNNIKDSQLGQPNDKILNWCSARTV